MNTTNMVCRDVKTLFGFCGHIVSTTIHMRPCPQTQSLDSNTNNNDNHDHDHNQQEGPCAGTEPYYLIRENVNCFWCFIVEWIGPEWDSRVGYPYWFPEEIIENRLTAFRNAIIATREIEPEEPRKEFKEALFQDLMRYEHAHNNWRHRRLFDQEFREQDEAARAAQIREPRISRVLKPVEGVPIESRCQICRQDYGVRDGEVDEPHDPVIILCGSKVPHEFGEVCVREWLRTHLSCPKCRGDVGEKYLREGLWGERDRFGNFRWGPVDPVLEELGLLEYQG